MARKVLELAELLSGLTFVFFYEKQNLALLHIEQRWGVTPETAVRAYFDVLATTIYQPQFNRFETVGPRYIVAWQWLNEQHTRVMVITCVDRERI